MPCKTQIFTQKEGNNKAIIHQQQPPNSPPVTNQRAIMQNVYNPIKSHDYAASTLMPAEKEGHRCCGGCCDVRRAVMIVNSVMIVGLTFGTIALVLGIEAMTSQVGNPDDDAAQKAAEQLAASTVDTSQLIFMLVFANIAQIICYGVGIYGALAYNECMVIISLCAYCVNAVGNIMMLNFVGFITVGLFAYPNIFLLKEIKAGTMTPDNYPNERHCCCV